MRITSFRLARATVLATLLAVVVALWIAPAGAHTALLRASPGPDETAGGSIEFVELAFLDPVTEAVVTVSYNGVPVAGTTILADGELIRFELAEALQDPGRYQVSYEMISFDSDYTTSGFFFTYDLNAPQSVLIEQAGEDSPFPLVATAVGVTALVALLGVFVWRLDGQRRGTLHADGYEDDAYGGYEDVYDGDYGNRDYGDRDHDHRDYGDSGYDDSTHDSDW